jgi:hypothetical protein
MNRSSTPTARGRRRHPMPRRSILCVLPRFPALLLMAGLIGFGPVAATVEETAPPSAADGPAAEPADAPAAPNVADAAAEILAVIQAGTVLKDMTMPQVLQARGEPMRREVIPPDAELWHYADGEVAFSEGKVSYVSLSESPLPTGVASDPRDLPPREQAQPQRHSPSQDPLGQVGFPPIRVGDTYVYRSGDPDGSAAPLTTRRTVTAITPNVVLSTLSLDSKSAKPRTLRFDRQWNLLASRSPDGSGRDYAPPLRYYDFPLFPGKTWQQTTTETDIRTGAVRIHTVAGLVEDWDMVTVPAGTFRAIKVRLRTEVYDPKSGEHIPGTDVSWYVPELKRSVKSVTTGQGGSRRLIELLQYSLKANP